MIIRARHNFLIYSFFKLYTVWKIRRNFQDIEINGEFHDRGLPVLLISNHISWWDGFWAVYLNRKVFKRKFFYFMMLEEQLKKNRFLSYTGGFSIKKKSLSIIESLNYTAELLGDKRNTVIIFPQGEIQSLYNSLINFDKGLEFILKKLTGEVHIIFLTSLVDYFSGQKPGLYMYFSEYFEKDLTVRTIEKEYGLFYKQCISENIKLKK
jgi:1-acyl-sn-glycerol-3-phosphate acyltransferase